MFAVLSDKTQKVERFIIKIDGKITKPKTEFSVTNPLKYKIKNSACATIENLSTPKLHLTLKEIETQGTKASTAESTENKEIKRPKIRLSTIKVGPYRRESNTGNGNNDANIDKKQIKKSKEIKTKFKKLNREGNYNCGRWTQEEHQRFIEAIMKFGNEWKQVQKHVGSRSSTQARSHAQKFFVKIKKSNVFDFNLDLNKNSIKTLHELANNMNSDEYFNAIKALNCVAFERRNNIKRRNRKDDTQLNDSSLINGESQNTIYLNDEIFSLNTNDQTIMNTTNIHNEAKFSYMTKTIDYLKNHTEDEPKVNDNDIIYGNKIKTEANKSENTKQTKWKNKQENPLTIIINNNINNYHYNVNINNCNVTENYVAKKRNRWNSFEGILNLFPELTKDGFNNCPNFKKTFDEKDYIDNFEFAFKEIKTDFDCEKDILEEIVILSNSEDSTNKNYKRKSEKNNFGFTIAPFYEDIKMNLDRGIKSESPFNHRLNELSLDMKEKEFDVFNFFTGHMN